MRPDCESSFFSSRFLEGFPPAADGDMGIYLKQQLKDKLIEYKQSFDKHGGTCRRFATGME